LVHKQLFLIQYEGSKKINFLLHVNLNLISNSCLSFRIIIW
jgi:hypothetical protein